MAIPPAKLPQGLFKQTLDLIEDKMAKKDVSLPFLNARQIYWLILEDLKKSDGDVGLNTIEDLFACVIKGQNLRQFLIDWDKCLLHFLKIPEVDILQPLFFRQIKEHTGFKHTLSIYETQLLTDRKPKDYDTLYAMVNRYLANQKQDDNNQRTDKNGKLIRMENGGELLELFPP